MTLEETYYEINRILGNNAEPLESVRLMETYRRYLKPVTVRVVLLAESHVFTSDEDRRTAIPPIDDMPGYPTQYARFVYCLGLGESDLTNDPHHPRRDGTPQFWKVLYACDNRVEDLEDFKPVQRGTSFPHRLQNKIHLLKNLKAKGIWLVDASIVAIYGSGVKVSRRRMTEVLRQSWESYTKQVVTSSNPERVICVGKGVARVRGDLSAQFPSFLRRAHGEFPEVLRYLQFLTLRCRHWRTRKSRVNTLPAKPLFTNRRYDMRARPGVGSE